MDQFIVHLYYLHQRADIRGYGTSGERGQQARRGAAAIRASVRRCSREPRRH